MHSPLGRCPGGVPLIVYLVLRFTREYSCAASHHESKLRIAGSVGHRGVPGGSGSVQRVTSLHRTDAPAPWTLSDLLMSGVSWLALLTLLVAGCSGASRYVIMSIPPRATAAPPTESWPPRDEDGIADVAWCKTACARVARPTERTRGCRLVDVTKYSLGVADGVECEFE